MHGILAVAAAHDRYLGNPLTPHRSMQEASHSYQCITLFRGWLTQSLRANVTEEHKDAIWATAVIVAILSFSSINVASSEGAWPLGTLDNSALEWLRLKVNDQSLWHFANPMRPKSVFRAISDTIAPAHRPLPQRGTDGIPATLATLCQLNEESTKQNSPHFVFAHTLSRLLEVPIGQASLGNILSAINHNSPQLLSLLSQKDPITLCLLYRWYVTSRVYIWWIDFRAKYEVPAIHTYLEQCHGDNESIQAFIATKQ